ncbi:sugar transferase [bacterium]|nr:MAG: sugar transferase [bacterium]
MHKGYRLKRPFDFCLALSGLVLSFSLWCLICFFIWLEDKKPVFYIQQRVGLNGKIFKLLKFRTMGYQKENSRLAKILRTSALDELPQLINILRGEMSFVGPRPLIPQELTLQIDFQDRSSVRPGLTGVAQLMVSKNASILDKTKYDSWYVQEQSLGLDILLILDSFWVSLSRKWDKSTL